MKTPFNTKTLVRGLSIVALAAVISACNDDDDDVVAMPEPPAPEPEPVMVTYDVTVLNLTNAQPISPVAVTLHETDGVFTVGMPASDALALMAEAGDNSALLEADGVLASASDSAPLPPGDSVTISVTIEDNTATVLSAVGMLVNTNDAFTGVSGLSMEGMEVGDSVSMTTLVYDAGTEENSEAAGTIPGPADMGEGASEGREVNDVVAMHPGVVSADDGLSTSVLTADHKFDNPALHITVTRMQ